MEDFHIFWCKSESFSADRILFGSGANAAISWLESLLILESILDV
jgi:hypothetical protein